MALFGTTHWSVLIDTRSDGARAAHAPEDAEDLVQAFFAHRVEQRAFASADRERGRFRNFPLAALKHFLAQQSAAANVQKRGGGRRHPSPDDEDADLERFRADDDAPERSFDRAGRGNGRAARRVVQAPLWLQGP